MVSDNTSLRQTLTLADYLYTLHLINHYQRMGRYRLAHQLMISNTKTRILLEKLVEANFIVKSSQRHGHKLSSSGKKIWEKCQQFFRIPSSRIHLGQNYTLGQKDAVVCVDAKGINSLNTVALRDEALLNGALGCTIFLKNQSGQFFLLDAIYPPLPQAALSDKKARRKLSRITLRIPWPRIIIIVGTANHVINAQIGAIAASFLLIPDEIKRNFRNLT